MHRLSWCASLTLAAAVGLAPSASADPLEDLEQAQQQLFDRVAPAVVFLKAGDAFGSGFFVSRAGLVLSNAHVVGSKGSAVEVVLHDGRKLIGTVVERAADDVDLALVQVGLSPTPALELGGLERLRVGSWVASIGHGLGGIWTYTTGMVSNIYPTADRPVFQTQIPLNPGSSGGPVLDRRGQVVGIVTAGVKEANNVNFAIRADLALRSLRGLETGGEFLVIDAPKDVPVLVDGRMAGKGPRVLMPARAGSYEIIAVVQGKMRRVRVSFPEQRWVDLTKAP